MIRSLERRVVLDDRDRAALRAMTIEVRSMPAATYLVREGQNPKRCSFLMEGYTYRQKLVADGDRALVSLQVPGDFIDIQNLFLDESDHDVQTLTHCVVAGFAIADLQALVDTHAGINRGLWTVGLVEASIMREWLLNIGRRNARTRISHLICEISARVGAVGQPLERAYALPMTQEQLGDALGLTSVHVNRVLKILEKEGLIVRRKREVTIGNRERLHIAADFNDRYLHLGSRINA